MEVHLVWVSVQTMGRPSPPVPSQEDESSQENPDLEQALLAPLQ